MGDARKKQEEAPAPAGRAAKEAPKAQRRAAPRPKKELVRKSPSAGAVPEPSPAPPEPDHGPAPPPASAYEAMLGFANAAFRQNLETSARLARCKSPLEIFAAQTAHAAALTQSFIAASLKLMHAGSAAAPWTPWKPRAGSQ
jgi:hypothetical protein